MRLWTLHPRYLDSRGLVALWREALLAQKVLRGGTKGYTRHPQLVRFRATADPGAVIAAYLSGVLEEARRRGYAFDAAKIEAERFVGTVDEAVGQLRYEWRHLREKLKRRDPARLRGHRGINTPEAHPLFRIVEGDVREWERVTRSDSNG
jgi:hypothetical protein